MTGLHRKWNVFSDIFGTKLRPSEPGALVFLAVVVSQWFGTRQHLKTERPSFYETILQLEAHPRLVATLREHREA
jgi:GST-like protein